MLQDIRDRSRGWLAYVIVGVIAVPLVLFGVYNYFTTGGEGPVAEVGDQEISSRQVNNAFRNQQQRLRQMLGENFDPSMIDEAGMKRRALEQLIDQAVLMNYARDAGLRISDEALGELIRSQQVFFQNGEFSRERYRTVLAENNLSPSAYERDLRVRQAINQLQQGVTAGVVVTEADLREAVALERQRREIAFLRLDADAFAGGVTVTDEEIQAFYEDNRSRFQQPERVKLEYVELTMDKLAQEAEISEETLRERYESVKDQRFTEPGSRQVRHILLSLPQDAGDDVVAEARAKLADIRRQIAGGEATFAEMARKHSADPGSAESGGDLGTVRRGDMVPPFEEAAFSLEEGALSEPVRTDFGLHLIQVTDIQEAKTKPFEAVREQLRQSMAGERLANRFYELGSQVANVAYESPDSLQAVADQFGLEIKSTDWIPQGGTQQGLGAQDAVVKAAFSDEVLEQGYNSELLTLSEQRKVVIRVAQHQPAKTRPLEAVRDQVTQTLTRRKASEAAQARGRELLDQLRSDGGDMAAVAAGADGIAFQNPGMVERDAADLPQPVVQTAFRLPRPEAGGAGYEGTGLPDGDFVVIRLSAVQDGKLSDLDDQGREELRERLRSVRGQAAMESLVQALRARADVTIHEQRL